MAAASATAADAHLAAGEFGDRDGEVAEEEKSIELPRRSHEQVPPRAKSSISSRREAIYDNLLDGRISLNVEAVEDPNRRGSITPPTVCVAPCPPLILDHGSGRVMSGCRVEIHGPCPTRHTCGSGRVGSGLVVFRVFSYNFRVWTSWDGFF
jgi:hypothetical protein